MTGAAGPDRTGVVARLDVRAQDAEERGEGICRTCLAPIWNEGGTVGHRKRAEGWSDRIVYAGVAGMTVGTDDGVIVLDLSTPERPEHTRLRIERQTALDLCDQIMDAVDVLDGGRWW